MLLNQVIKVIFSEIRSQKSSKSWNHSGVYKNQHKQIPEQQHNQWKQTRTKFQNTKINQGHIRNINTLQKT